MFLYPRELLPTLKGYWAERRLHPEEKVPPLPRDDVIIRLLEVAYHMSFSVEEGRRLAFNIAYCGSEEKSEGPQDEEAISHGGKIRFGSTRKFSASQILRLAPAADPVRSLIGVELVEDDGDDDPNLVIWGLFDIGSSWWRFVHGETCPGGGITPPNCLVISSMEPGHLAVSRGPVTLLTLRHGTMHRPTAVMHNGPIARYFAKAIDKITEQSVARLTAEERDFDPDLCLRPSHVLVGFVARVLALMREKSHGGTVLIVPDEWQAGDPRLQDRAMLKYECPMARPWSLALDRLVAQRKHRTLEFAIYDSKIYTTRDVHRTETKLRRQADSLRSALDDCAGFVASLSAVDGAILMTDRLRLLGFGAEVVATSHSLDCIRLADTSAGDTGHVAPIESYGTRHRSAFRFCSSHADTVAFVVSQDGGVRAVKRLGPDLVCWPDIDLRFLAV